MKKILSLIIICFLVILTGCEKQTSMKGSDKLFEEIATESEEINKILNEVELMNPDLLSLVNDNKYTSGTYTIEMDTDISEKDTLRYKFIIENDKIVSLELLNQDISIYSSELMLFIDGISPLIEGLKIDEVDKYSSINGNYNMAKIFNEKFEKLKTNVLTKNINKEGIEAGSGVDAESGLEAVSVTI